MKNFRTFDCAADFYRLASSLRLPTALKQQLSRASSSIALNLAEGRGKPTKADQLRFFHIAMGSVRECQAIFLLGNMSHSPAAQKLDQLAAMVYRLIQYAR